MPINFFLESITPIQPKLFFVIVISALDIFSSNFDNGNLWQEYNFKSGEQHGKNIEYYEDGSVSIYHNFKDGKLHGLQEQYYPSGNLETRTTYKNGLIEGVHIYLSEDGDVIEEKIMKKGLDITMELMAFMMENEGEHMIKAGILKDGPQDTPDHGDEMA